MPEVPLEVDDPPKREPVVGVERLYPLLPPNRLLPLVDEPVDGFTPLLSCLPPSNFLKSPVGLEPVFVLMVPVLILPLRSFPGRVVVWSFGCLPDCPPKCPPL